MAANIQDLTTVWNFEKRIGASCAASLTMMALCYEIKRLLPENSRNRGILKPEIRAPCSETKIFQRSAQKQCKKPH
jgi:hypothetical protein